VRVPLRLLRGVVADVDLAADDRIHAVLARLLVELHRARERAVVGEPDGRHLELRGARRKSRDAAGAVEDRVLGVDVQVDELGAQWTANSCSVIGRSPHRPSKRFAPLGGAHFSAPELVRPAERH
jgi:hypothetical protein